MKILKYILFIVLIAFIAGSIYIATKDGDYQMERKNTIPGPITLVFNEVKDLKTWNNWFPMNKKEIILSFSEKTVGQGAQMSWKSEDLGNGSIITQEVVPYSAILQRMVLETGIGEADGNMYWKFEEKEDSTVVTWGIKGDLDFKEKLAFLLEDTEIAKKFAPVFEDGLRELEEQITQKMEEYTIHVDGTTQHGGGYYMYSTTATKLNEVYKKASEMTEQVSLYMNKNNISINGNPFIIYNKKNQANGTTIFSAAVPTPSMVVTPSGSPVLNGFLPPQKVVKTTLKGNYKNATEAWETTYRYIYENNLKVDEQGEPFEIFITGPVEEPNPANWVTEIYIPVEEKNPEKDNTNMD